MRYTELGQRSLGQVSLFRIERVIREDARTAEEARQHHVKAARVPRTRRHQVVRHDPEQGTQLKYIPILLPENGHTRSFANHRVTLASDGFNQGRFAASVWSEHRNMFVGMNAQTEVVERGLQAINAHAAHTAASQVAAHHADVPQIEQWSL